MIEILEQDGNIICLNAKGKLTHNDYQQVLIPRLEQVIKAHGKARVLFALGEEFHGCEPEAMWDDAKFGMQHRTDFENWLFVGSKEGGKNAATISSFIATCKEHKINPQQYLLDVLTRLASGESSETVPLPDVWVPRFQ